VGVSSCVRVCDGLLSSLPRLDTTDLRKNEIGSSVASMRQFEAIGQCNFMGIQNGNKKGVKCVTHLTSEGTRDVDYTLYNCTSTPERVQYPYSRALQYQYSTTMYTDPVHVQRFTVHVHVDWVHMNPQKYYWY
jgi:hypothetical protein